MHKDNFYILTGGPGSGKSSVISVLSESHDVVYESAREVIKQQKLIGSVINQNEDRLGFAKLLLEQGINDYLLQSKKADPVFFDRGFPDLLAYKTIAEGEAWAKMIKTIEEAVAEYRYNPKVFIFPPWEAIYQQDDERTHSFEQALNAYQALKSSYHEAGYELVEVPKEAVESRCDFILGVVG